MYDVIIIGKGPAGISTSLYTARAGLKTLIVSTDNSALNTADAIQNYYGFEKPISGKYLIEQGVKQAKSVGVEIIDNEVLDISWNSNFIVKTLKHNLEGKVIVIASGAKRKSVRIENLKKFEGMGVSYCATCDAFFFRKKRVAILGNSHYALHELNAIKGVAASSVIFTNGAPIEEDFSDVEVIEKKIVKLEGEEKLQKVIFEDGSSYELDGLFIALGQASSDILAQKIGAPSVNGYIVTDEYKSTQIPGLYAVGDCTGGLLQIAKAVSDGAIAGSHIIKTLRSKK